MLIGISLCGGPTAQAAEPAAVGEHCEHEQHAREKTGTTTTDEQRTVPHVLLVDESEREVELEQILGAGRPVVLQFIFTTCTTICPLLSGTLSAAQQKLQEIDPSVQLVSISVDPERDTPAALRAYAARHRARDNWTFLTGDRDSIRMVLKAFGAYYEGNNKMYHQPYTFMHGSKDGLWRRITGLASNAELVGTFRDLVKAPHRASKS